jgi:hypothetical protein
MDLRRTSSAAEAVSVTRAAGVEPRGPTSPASIVSTEVNAEPTSSGAVRGRAPDRSNPCCSLENVPALMPGSGRHSARKFQMRDDRCRRGVRVSPAGLSGLRKPAVGHDQFDLFVLDRVTPDFAAIGVNAAVTVDPVERSSADTHHH